MIRRIKSGTASRGAAPQVTGKPASGSSQFPGTQKGLNRQQVSDFIKDQPRRKGFRVSGGAGSTVSFKLDIPGNARFLYGLAAGGLIDADFTLEVNNEIVWESIAGNFLVFGATEQDYYAVNRPLSGNDQVTLKVTGISAYDNEPMYLVFK